MFSATSLHGVRLRPSAVEERDLVITITGQLLDADLATAPHVVAALVRSLGADPVAVRETVALLTPGQRTGQRMLPRPLPLVPAMSAAFDDRVLDHDEHLALLIAAHCTDDRLEVLLTATGLSAGDLVDGALACHVSASRGGFAFVDPRFPIWLQHTASAAASIRAHALLADAHRSLDEPLCEQWHRARGALERTPEIVPALIVAARELNEAGHSSWAFRVAMEAAEHALGDARDEARLVAGTAAVAAGCMEDASELLGSLFPAGAPAHRAQALASLLVADATAKGVLPALDPVDHRPAADADPAHWYAWARTAGLAALLCAERGAIGPMRSWLGEARSADLTAGVDGAVRDAAVALCWILTGEGDDGAPEPASGPFCGALVAALRAAVDDDIDLGLQILARARAGLRDEIDPLIAGFERSALVEAYLAVAEVLLRFWAGEVAEASELLSAYTVDLPVAVPFAGLAITLAHRLELTASTRSQPSALTRALTACASGALRIESLVDSGIRSYLAGDPEQAATDIGLWHQRGAQGTLLVVPGLDEVGRAIAPGGVEPAGLAHARNLVHRARMLSEMSWRREVLEIAEEGARLHSPFAQARLEAVLGSICARHGDQAGGRRHLRASHTLFAAIGADAWRSLVEERLVRLGDQMAAAATVATAPITIMHDLDPLAASRIAWESVLTRRELEVAMRIAQGAQNREIADEFGSSVRTVEVHVGKIFAKLGVRSRVELTGLAHRAGRHL